MDEIQMVETNALEISDATLMVLAQVGLVCGPAKALEYQVQGRLAIVKVEPLIARDPIVAIPLVKAPPETWALLREYFDLVTRLVEPRQSRPVQREAHEKAVAMIPQVVEAFVGRLAPVELRRFERWLYVSMIGTPRIWGCNDAAGV